MNIGIPSIAIDTSHTLPLSSEMHIASSTHLAFLFFTNVKHGTRISTLSKKPNNPHCRGSPSTSGVSFVDENFIERRLDRVQSKRWKREREREEYKVERANSFALSSVDPRAADLVPWRRQQKAMPRQKEAFGELNYLKAAQEQAPFMSCPAQWRLCGPVAYTCCVHALTYMVAARRWPRWHRRECANNEGKFVPRSH